VPKSRARTTNRKQPRCTRNLWSQSVPTCGDQSRGTALTRRRVRVVGRECPLQPTPRVRGHRRPLAPATEAQRNRQAAAPQSGAPTSAIHPAVAVPSDKFRSVMMGSFAGGKRGEVVRWEMCDVDDALRPDRRAGSRHDDRATRARPPDNPRLRSAAEMTTLGRPAHRDHRTSKTARHTVHCAGAGRELALPTAPRRDSPPQGRRAMTVPIGSEWQ
jgi:hypothetical protein